MHRLHLLLTICTTVYGTLVNLVSKPLNMMHMAFSKRTFKISVSIALRRLVDFVLI